MERRRLPSLRRAIYQIHLWTGLVLALYLLMLSVTGSALVYRLELNRHFATPAPRFDPGRPPLTTEALRAAAVRAYPGWAVVDVGTRIRRHRPVVTVRLTRGDDALERLLDPYTGADLGDAMSRVMRTLTWLSLLHDELLLGEAGRRVNGYASAAVVLLVVTGAIVWWPRGWSARRLTAAAPGRTSYAGWHRSVGVWSLGILLVWAVSGVYFAFPEPFDALASAVSGDDLTGMGYEALTWLTYLHFGRFSSAAQVVWLVIGLLPAVLVVTGVAMWGGRRFRRGAIRAPASVTPDRTRWFAGRTAAMATLLATACVAWATYAWANYREERLVAQFIEMLAAGRYREAHGMWEDDEYAFEAFVADWGAGGRHSAAGPIAIVDSTTYGAVVTVYVQTGDPVPLALEVDKETMLLSYAPSNEYAPSTDRR